MKESIDVAGPLKDSKKEWCPLCGAQEPKEFLFSEPVSEDPQRSTEFTFSTVDVVRCMACNFVFVRRSMTEDTIADFYRSETGLRIAANMENFGWALQNVSSSFVDVLDKLGASTGKGRLLDVGCGRGMFAHLAKEIGWESMGLDINAELTRFVADDLKIPTVTGTIYSAELPTESFDAVAALDVMEHLYDPVVALKRIYELVRPGGRVIVKCPNWKAQLAKERTKHTLGLGSGNIATIGHLNQFDQRTLANLLVRAGFTSVRVFPAEVFLPAIRNAGFRPRLWVEYIVKAGVNLFIGGAYKVTGLNLGLNLLATGARPI